MASVKKKQPQLVIDEGHYILDCELTEAVNPVTYSTCKLQPPVILHSLEELDKFTAKWEEFCGEAWRIAKIDPAEVSFCLA